jgi:hypothetical protein
MARSYIFKFLIAFDMLVATLIWRNADITISAYAGLAMRKRTPPFWAKFLSMYLNVISPDHCENALVDDTARAKAALVILGAK